MSVTVLVAAVAFVLPSLIAIRKRPATDALAWADFVQRDPASHWAADRVIRALEASCSAAGVVFPGAVRILVGSTVRIDLVSPTIGPPEPWVTTPDGRTWSAPMAALQAVPLQDASPGQFTTTVAVGVDADSSVLVDLSNVRGVVALSGDRGARSAVLHRVVEQLRSQPWTTSTALRGVGVDLGPLVPTTMRAAVAAIAADDGPGLLVVSKVPSDADGRELARLLERPGGRWACISMTPHAAARWTLEARRDGTHVSDMLGLLDWVSLGAPIAAAPTRVGDASASADARVGS